AARASTTDADTPSSRKDCCDTLFNSFSHVRESPSPNVRRRNEKLFSRAGRIADRQLTVAVRRSGGSPSPTGAGRPSLILRRSALRAGDDWCGYLPFSLA